MARRAELADALGDRWHAALGWAVGNWTFDYLALVSALMILDARDPARFRRGGASPPLWDARPGGRRLLLGIVHGEVIDAARADLWASGLGQDDTRSPARPQDPRDQVGQGPVDDRLGLDVWDDELRVRVERQLWALAQELLAKVRA